MLNQTSHLKKSRSDRRFPNNTCETWETNWNKGRFQGQIDIPLNKNGKDQAVKTSKYLKEVKFNKAFSSSMGRPYETAQIILQNIPNLKIINLMN